jgi:hypothetical protein
MSDQKYPNKQTVPDTAKAAGLSKPGKPSAPRQILTRQDTRPAPEGGKAPNVKA